ncbi:hypothetical protein PGB90_000382 [Kerria lacca]
MCPAGAPLFIYFNVVFEPPTSLGETDDLEHMPENQFLPLRGNTARYSSTAYQIRENFCKYFNHEGAVPWQHAGVLRGNY